MSTRTDADAGDVVDVETPAGIGGLVVRTPAGPPRAVVVLGHGAGGGPTASDLVAVSDALVAWGAVVARAVQPYRRAGRRAPPPPTHLDPAFASLVRAARRGRDGLPLVVGGRSSGARVACRTAVATGAVGVLALAFPLHPPGRPAATRRPELLDAGVPVLLLQGERDAFGRPEEFRAGAPALPYSVTMVVVPGADHGLRRGVATALPAVASWVADVVGFTFAGD